MKDDVISRQEAIDALERKLAEPYHTGEDWYVGINCAEAEIYGLPSIQPEINCSEIPNASDFVSRKAVRNMVSAWAYDLMEQEDLNMALHDVDELPPVSVEREGGKKNEGHF